MDNLTGLLDRILGWVLLPATLYGAGGALLRAGRRKDKSARQTVAEVFGGAVIANVVCPLVQDVTPEKWHYTLFFLVGWGGLELIGRAYEALAQGLESRIRRQVGGE